MVKIEVEHRNILDYVKYVLSNLENGTLDIENAKYHHNSSYENAISICRYGILTIQDLKNIKNLTEDDIEKMSDIESHVNGNNAVSLAVMGLNDLSEKEFEYNAYNRNLVDFLVTSDITASRSTHHYGNEYLSYGSIGIDKLKSIDIRILKLISSLGKNPDEQQIKSVIHKYNYLREIALVMKELQLSIPLREMSSDKKVVLDIEKLAKIPQLIIK